MHRKVLLTLYAIPYTYIAIWVLWFVDTRPSSPYAIVGTVDFALLVVPSILSGFCGMRSDKRIVLIGNAINFATALVLTLATNSVGLRNELGATWHGVTSPFYTEQFIVVVFLASIIVQFIVYNVAKRSEV